MKIVKISGDKVTVTDGTGRFFVLGKSIFNWEIKILDEIEVFENDGQFSVARLEKVSRNLPHMEGDMTIEEWLNILLNH